MILAFCIRDIDSPVELDDRFGRCAGFAIVEAARSGSFRIIRTLENLSRDSAGAAGTGAVQILSNEGVEGVIAPHLGPKAEDARIKIGLHRWNQGAHTTMDGALEAWTAGGLEEMPSVPKSQGLYRA